MTLLEGKRLLLTGVLTEASLAFGVAKLAQAEGAEIIITSVDKVMKHTRKAAAKLPVEPEIIEFDVSDPDHVDRRPRARSSSGGVASTAPCTRSASPRRSASVARSWTRGWDDVVGRGQRLRLLAQGARRRGGAADDRGRVHRRSRLRRHTSAWPGYDWMGVAKAALESTSRYLARYLGEQRIRVNLVAAGPIKTIAARSIPGFSKFEDVWDERAPLGWDVKDSEAVAKACVALLSDWFPMTTGEIIHVDGGFHAIGA